MTLVHIDFETYSEADIKSVGAWLYAEHPSTFIRCVAWTENADEYVGLTEGDYWRTGKGCINDIHTLDTFDGPEFTFVAHNAGFEQAIWQRHMVEKYGFYPLPPERWKCTMAKAYAHGLPGSLAGVGAALNLPMQKDKEGDRLIKLLCCPHRCYRNNQERCIERGIHPANGKFWTYDEIPDEFDKLYAYCRRDVEVERVVDKALRDLSPQEQKVWVLDQKMNQRGVQLDLKSVSRAIALSTTHMGLVSASFAALTGGIAPSQGAKTKEWLAKNGTPVLDLQAPTVKALLEKTSGVVNEALQLYAEASKTSLAKYPQMLNRSGASGTLRESVAYHGAHTGRWAGRGVQLQNLPRPTEDIPNVVDALSLGYDCFRFVYDDPATALSSAIRGMIVPRRGNKFYVGDFGQIEARVIAWLAGQQDALEVFINGEDPYCRAASIIYGRPITKADKKERQVGKIAVLSLGYQGGIGAFAKMAKGNGVDLSVIVDFILKGATPDEMDSAEYHYMLYCKKTPTEDRVSKPIGYTCNIIKERWREGHPLVVEYWERLENQAIAAVISGKPHDVDGVRFFTTEEYFGELDDYCEPVKHIFLWCKLPSKRVLCYPFAKVQVGQRGKLTLTFKHVDYQSKWTRTSTYGGSLAENIVQAVSRDVMAEAMLRLEDAGYTVVLTVHDEDVSETPVDFGTLEEFNDLMSEAPKWAVGLPIHVDAWEGNRYGKPS